MPENGSIAEIPLGSRILAGLVHLGTWFADLGLIGTLILFSIYRSRSVYVADHAKQALVYQVCVLAVSLAARIAVLNLFGHQLPGEITELAPGELPLPFQVVYYGYRGLQAYSVVGSFAGFNGRAFEYPLFGRWVSRFGEEDE